MPRGSTGWPTTSTATDPAEPTAKLIDVEILGHIFEQSITDLEELHRTRSRRARPPPGRRKRKKEGAFYTPAFVTRYVVAETLGPVLRERFERPEGPARGRGHADGPQACSTDPATFDPDALNEPQKEALVRFWDGWIDELEAVRVVDPACGSGAFLIEAFDQLFAEYGEAQGRLTELRGPTLFDIDKHDPAKNLFGVDLNGEAVEIARLSCWIKTAEVGQGADHPGRQHPGRATAWSPTRPPTRGRRLAGRASRRCSRPAGSTP